MIVTKEHVRKNIQKFLGEKYAGSVPYILSEVFLRFADDRSIIARAMDSEVPNSTVETYVGTVDDITVSLVVYTDMAFINILKDRGIDNPFPYRTSLAKITLTRATFQIEVLLKEDGILDFDLPVVQLIGKMAKEIVQVRKKAS